MASSDRGPLQQARSAFAEARTTLIDRLYAFEKATDDLREARRRIAPGPDLDALEDGLDAAQTELTQARANEAATRSDLQIAIANWLPTNADASSAAEEDITRLESTEPIVLFPVRLETRFDDGFLKVRVFPDEIFLNTHETALTEEERDAARAYYEELNENNNERELWRDIVARFGVERSAYILRQMLPVFGDPGATSTWSSSSSTCGGTITGGNDLDLHFPDVQLRSSSWTRPGEAILPDRWMVVTYRGSSKRYTLGNPILEPLAMTPDPKLENENSLSDLISTTRGTYRIDDNIRWTVDFDRAVQVGMGIQVPLEGDDGTVGFDRVVVVGVKTSLTSSESSRLLEKLFDAHHYTRGVAMVRQGSPTNNTEEQSTPYPRKENAGEQSFVIERQPAPLDREFAHHCMPRDSDGYALAAMLGVPSGVMANVERAGEHEIVRAILMNIVLWPGTIGYFMRHLMASAVIGGTPIFTTEQIENARSYFAGFVNGRGPAPAFRVGGTPYGVLPIVSLADWEERVFSTSDSSTILEVERNLVMPLQRLLAFWLEGTTKVPRIEPGSANPDVQLARVLSNYPNAREFWFRGGTTGTFTVHQFLLLGWSVLDLWEDLALQSRETFGRIGFESWRPALGTTLWNRNSYRYTGTVVADPLSETDPLSPNFIDAIADASAQVLNEQTDPNFPTDSNLLYRVLRHSTLAEYSRIAAQETQTVWSDLGIFGIFSGETTIIPSVYSLDTQGTLKSLAEVHLGALRALAPVPTAELERLFTDSLDVASRRLDAWITAVASRRVRSMRSAQEATRLATTGDFLGGYGWLENVRPVARQTQTLPDTRIVEVQPGNGGFFHTPSMSHAAAAALLRNGHLSFKGEDAAAYAVDLSSRRVRDARLIFEAARNGQPVGALFGYQFERALHEGYPGTSGLDDLRFKLRSRFPLVANKTGHDGDEPAEAIAARNVLDGEQLLRAYQNNELDFDNDPDLPSPGTAQYDAMTTELRKLERRYDAAADLLTAEAVFQLVRGNIDAASATMADVVDGKHPPDSIISKSARGGIGISHRIALIFPSNVALDLPGTWPDPTPRAQAEPVLNAWLGQLVGDPAGISATVTYLDENGGIIQATGGGTPLDSVTVRLDELGIHPLDLLALAEVVPQSQQASMLDRRIISVALNDPNRAPSSPAATFRVEYTLSNGRSFPQILEILHAAHVVLRASRPLELSDLLSPAEIEEGTAEDPSSPPAQTALDFYQRGQDAAAALQSARDALDAAVSSDSGFRAALETAAYFLPLSAFPEPGVADETAYKPAAEAVLKELERRIGELPDSFNTPGDEASADLLSNGKQTLEAVFGSSFVALPDLDPPQPSEIELSLGARATLLANDDAAPDRCLQQMMRSRDRLARYRKLNLYARTAGLGRPRVHVLQLPYVPQEKWLGLPFDTPPEEGRAAVLLLSYAQVLDPTFAWRGLVIDDWTEVIPNRFEETGFGFHYKSPKAEAPQAILVAAPARNADTWSFAELLASLEQTMDLMKCRAVETEYLDLGQIIPLTVFGTNPNITNTVSTNFFDSVAQEIRQALDG